MANRYANLIGSNKIKDEWQKINEGFDKVQQEMDEKPDASIAKVNDIQLGADDTLTLEGGTGITVTTVPGEKKVRFVATGESTPGPHAIEHITGGSDVIPNATTSASGLMSAADKLALDAHLAALVSDPGGVHGLRVETGTFTPEFSGATGADYTTQEGRYVRFGNLVYFSIRIVLSQKGSLSGEVAIIGLPFVATNTYISVSVGNYSGLNLPSPYSGVTAYIYPASRLVRLRKTRNTDSSPLEDTDITNNAQFMISGVYQI